MTQIVAKNCQVHDGVAVRALLAVQHLRPSFSPPSMVPPGSSPAAPCLTLVVHHSCPYPATYTVCTLLTGKSFRPCPFLFYPWHARPQVGLHVPHHLLHAVEGAGIFIAVVSTVAAAVAEILAMRHQPQQRAHDAAAVAVVAARAAAVAEAAGGGVGGVAVSRDGKGRTLTATMAGRAGKSGMAAAVLAAAAEVGAGRDGEGEGEGEGRGEELAGSPA